MTILYYNPNTGLLIADAGAVSVKDGSEHRTHHNTKIHNLKYGETNKVDDEYCIAAARCGNKRVSMRIIKEIESVGITDTAHRLIAGRLDIGAGRAKVLVITDRRIVTLDSHGRLKDVTDSKTPILLGSGRRLIRVLLEDFGLSIENALALAPMLTPKISPVTVSIEVDRKNRRLSNFNITAWKYCPELEDRVNQLHSLLEGARLLYPELSGRLPDTKLHGDQRNRIG